MKLIRKSMFEDHQWFESLFSFKSSNWLHLKLKSCYWSPTQSLCWNKNDLKIDIKCKNRNHNQNQNQTLNWNQMQNQKKNTIKITKFSICSYLWYDLASNRCKHWLYINSQHFRQDSQQPTYSKWNTHAYCVFLLVVCIIFSPIE